MAEQKKDYLNRIMNYCARAERCTYDVQKKLATWEVPIEETDEIMQRLREDKYLDDVRYAKCYVSDKWKLDLWGRGKIKNGLYQKGFRDPALQEALQLIDQDEYVHGLHHLLSKKRDSISRETRIAQMKKLLRYGFTRGFEEDLIWKWLEQKGYSFEENNTPEE